MSNTKSNSKRLAFIWLAIFVIFYAIFSNSKKHNSESNSSNSNSNEEICPVCYHKFDKNDGWGYDVGGVPTQQFKNQNYFCSYYCAQQRGKENTPKSWQKQYN
jgi:hypothetical protein